MSRHIPLNDRLVRSPITGYSQQRVRTRSPPKPGRLGRLFGTSSPRSRRCWRCSWSGWQSASTPGKGSSQGMYWSTNRRRTRGPGVLARFEVELDARSWAV